METYLIKEVELDNGFILFTTDDDKAMFIPLTLVVKIVPYATNKLAITTSAPADINGYKKW